MDAQVLQALIDRVTIIELMNSYGMAIDLRDWETFQCLFASSVEFDYASIGIPMRRLSPQEIVETARRDLAGFQATQHLITNHQVEITGNAATGVAQVSAIHFLPNQEGDATFEMGGYYRATLVRRGAAWKIQRWQFTVLWSRGNRDLFRLLSPSPHRAAAMPASIFSCRKSATPSMAPSVPSACRRGIRSSRMTPRNRVVKMGTVARSKAPENAVV